jgi:hypothetical protein
MEAKKQYGCKDCVQESSLSREAMKISRDNQSAIFMAKNPTYHSKTKHIDVQYHFVRDMVQRNKVLLEKVDTLENIARIIDQVCECCEVLLVQRGNGHCYPRSVN